MLIDSKVSRLHFTWSLYQKNPLYIIASVYSTNFGTKKTYQFYLYFHMLIVNNLDSSTTVAMYGHEYIINLCLFKIHIHKVFIFTACDE